MSKTIVTVSYRALPGQVDAARQALDSLVSAVLSSEPDCSGITTLQDANDPSRLLLIEHWPSQDIFLGPHMQQPHIQSFIQQASTLFAGPPEISFWHPASAV